MIKYFCDCFGAEVDQLHKIPFLCHIIEDFPPHKKMVNGKSIPFSGRVVNKDCCLSCYNHIMDKTWEVFQEHQKTLNNESK